MSLINQMLQDLDARGTPAADSLQLNIKSVAREERRFPLALVAGVACGALAIAAAGGFAWHYLHKPAPMAAQPVVVVMTPPAAVKPAPAPATVAVAPEPVAVEVTPPAAAQGAEPEPAKVEAAAPEASPHKMTRKERRAEKRRLAAEKKLKAAEAKQTIDAEPKKAKKAKPALDDAVPEPTKAKKAKPAQDDAVAEPKKTRRAEAAAAGRQETPGQRAEGAYRRGLASLQEGRIGEATAALEQALQVDPKHDAARQTLVGLLIESHRTDEAMRQLQLGLTLDPRQPALAMLLARLQIERGGSGIETLTRTLPYAAGNGEYQAFLAGALQRQQRHREAAEQYQAALRSQPQNGVWWMGLGISLQADKRNAEALDAFQKASAAGLSPELQGFVERKLRQLGR